MRRISGDVAGTEWRRVRGRRLRLRWKRDLTAAGRQPLDYLVLPDGKTPASTLLNRPAPAPAEPEPAPKPQLSPGSDWFGPVTAPPQASRERPFPAISGHLSSLDECLQHLHRVADYSDFIVVPFKTAPAGADPLASCDMRRQRVYINEIFWDEPAFYAFVMAHEMGHALDPRYQFDPQDYNGVRKSGYEVVAEASAVNALRSFGLVLDDADRFLDEQFSRRWVPGGWRKSLEWGLYDRYMCGPSPAVEGGPRRGTPQAHEDRRPGVEARAPGRSPAPEAPVAPADSAAGQKPTTSRSARSAGLPAGGR